MYIYICTYIWKLVFSGIICRDISFVSLAVPLLKDKKIEIILLSWKVGMETTCLSDIPIAQWHTVRLVWDLITLCCKGLSCLFMKLWKCYTASHSSFFQWCKHVPFLCSSNFLQLPARVGQEQICCAYVHSEHVTHVYFTISKAILLSKWLFISKC